LKEFEDKYFKVELEEDKDNKFKNVLDLPLKQHQQNVVKTLLNQKRVFIGADMGTGKTAISLARIVVANNGLKTLVVCKASLVDQWWKEINKFCPWLAKDIDIINFERIFKKSQIERMSQYNNDFNLIIDEVGKIGNLYSNRTKYCIGLMQKASTLQLLSGSFFGGRYEKFYPCSTGLWFNGSFTKFFDRYVKWHEKLRVYSTPYGKESKVDKIIDSYTNLEELFDKTITTGAVFLKLDECLTGDDCMPPREITNVHVEATKKAKRLSGYFSLKMKTSSDEEIAKLFGKLKNISSIDKSLNKKLKLVDLLGQTPGRCIVVYTLNVEKEAIINIVNDMKRPVAEISGQKKDFKTFEEEENAVMVAQSSIIAEGFNLQKANTMIFTSPLPGELQMQAERRIWRIGQTKPCKYYIIYADDYFERNSMEKVDICREELAKIG
jgi:hypothetical protein